MKYSGFDGPLKLDLTKIDMPLKIDPTVLLDLPIPQSLWAINPRNMMGKAWWLPAPVVRCNYGESITMIH